METIQITGLSLNEFQRMLNEVVELAVNIAISKFTAIKQDPNEEITITTIAEMWSCSKRTVSRRIKYHHVPTIKLGKETSIKRKYLEVIKKPVPKSY